MLMRNVIIVNKETLGTVLAALAIVFAFKLHTSVRQVATTHVLLVLGCPIQKNIDINLQWQQVKKMFQPTLTSSPESFTEETVLIIKAVTFVNP